MSRPSAPESGDGPTSEKGDEPTARAHTITGDEHRADVEAAPRASAWRSGVIESADDLANLMVGVADHATYNLADTDADLSYPVEIRLAVDVEVTEAEP